MFFPKKSGGGGKGGGSPLLFWGENTVGKIAIEKNSFVKNSLRLY